MKLFEDKQVRSSFNEKEQKWYFIIIDVIEILVQNKRARKYWSNLKVKLTKEVAELSEKIGQLKMDANELHINNFLQAPNVQFAIPVYQRNYDWTNTYT